MSNGMAGVLADRLEAATDALIDEVAKLSEELVVWKPADDVWSIKEILCHVAEFVPYWTSQLLQIVGHPEDPWGRDHTDRARIDAVHSADSRSIDHALNAVRSGSRASAAAIRNLLDSDFDITAMSRNPRWARKPASFVVNDLLTGHVEKHLGQIRRNVRQFQERDSVAG
jgi:uncharacterized damage-inducible protein DinB